MPRPIGLMSTALATAVLSSIAPFIGPPSPAASAPAVFGGPSPPAIHPGVATPGLISSGSLPGAPISAVNAAATAQPAGLPKSGAGVGLLSNAAVILKPGARQTYSANVVLYNPSSCRYIVTGIAPKLWDRDNAPVTVQASAGTFKTLDVESNDTRSYVLNVPLPSQIALPVAGYVKIVSTPKSPDPADAAKTRSVAERSGRGQGKDQKPSQRTHKKSGCDASEQSSYSALQIAFDSRAKAATIFERSGILAGVVVLIALAVLLKLKVGLENRMGGGTWNFSQSWGSNVTLGGALLTTFLSLSLFPDQPHLMDKAGYSLLNTIFSSLVALAPLVYGLIVKKVQADSGGISTIDSQGYVVMFLLAGGVVLWAAFGQILTLNTLIQDFVLSSELDGEMGKILIGVAWLLIGLVLIYGVSSLIMTASSHGTPAEQAAGKQETIPMPLGTLLPHDHELRPPLAEWSFL